MNTSDREMVDRARAQTGAMRREFIQTELELGSTLLDLAETELAWESKKDAEGLLAKAIAACSEAAYYLLKASRRLDQRSLEIPDSLQALEDRLEALKARIDATRKKIRQRA